MLYVHPSSNGGDEKKEKLNGENNIERKSFGKLFQVIFVVVFSHTDRAGATSCSSGSLQT